MRRLETPPADMSISEGLKGAALEYSRLPTFFTKAKYVAKTSKLFLAELVGTLGLAPHAIRTSRLHGLLEPVTLGASSSTRLRSEHVAQHVLCCLCKHAHSCVLPLAQQSIAVLLHRSHAARLDLDMGALFASPQHPCTCRPARARCYAVQRRALWPCATKCARHLRPSAAAQPAPVTGHCDHL